MKKESFMICQKIVLPLLSWYESSARDLPWRENNDPYRVWVSEIMLQQTRVEAVKPYYARFLARFPTIESLASASEEELLKLWEGLGYYSRARNLQKAAQRIVSQYNGNFPREYEAVLSLPGIGAYTAGAICSICFDAPTPAVDGNVLRVISRLCENDEDINLPRVKREISDLLMAVYPLGKAGEFTQSLMELGATVCVPNGAPQCERCPLEHICLARQNETQGSIPVKSAKPARRKEDKTMLLLICDNTIAVRKRADDVLLGGMYEFPSVDGICSKTEVEELIASWGLSPIDSRPYAPKKHIFTHIEWNMERWRISCREKSGDFLWATEQQLRDELALPTAFRKLLDKIHFD